MAEAAAPLAAVTQQPAPPAPSGTAEGTNGEAEANGEAALAAPAEEEEEGGEGEGEGEGKALPRGKTAGSDTVKGGGRAKNWRIPEALALAQAGSEASLRGQATSDDLEGRKTWASFSSDCNMLGTRSTRKRCLRIPNTLSMSFLTDSHLRVADMGQESQLRQWHCNVRLSVWSGLQ